MSRNEVFQAGQHARPSFLITIDTEGDDLWSRPSGKVGTQNALFLPRFQALCERYGFKPTYLTNYEMAMSEAYCEFARDAVSRGTAEVGMHLHAWDSPPERPLTAEDHRHHPFLVDYPLEAMREKVAFMTQLLSDKFGVAMRSHRAGRWAFDERYAALLVDYGYCVDCSVTPGVSWAEATGAPGRVGTDYTHFPEQPYFLDLQDISRPGDSNLLELPMTIGRSAWHRANPKVYDGLLGKVLRRVSPELCWLRPNGRNLPGMIKLVDQCAADGREHLEFMLHSSEFMPGGSPVFPDEASIERLYEHMDALFAHIASRFSGATLSEFHDRHVLARSRSLSPAKAA